MKMKEKNIEKIIGKLAGFGKVKIENDGKGKYLIVESPLLPCAQEVHVETLERDLLYIRDLMVMEAEEEADAYADAPQSREKWLKATERIAELEAEWERIIPDVHVTVILHENGNGDMYAVRLRTAGYDEDEIRQIWHDSGMRLNVFLDRLRDLDCEPEAEKVKWNFSK
jgi:hypothetical protein